jgi:hypothetical protein
MILFNSICKSLKIVNKIEDKTFGGGQIMSYDEVQLMHKNDNEIK